MTIETITITRIDSEHVSVAKAGYGATAKVRVYADGGTRVVAGPEWLAKAVVEAARRRGDGSHRANAASLWLQAAAAPATPMTIDQIAPADDTLSR